MNVFKWDGTDISDFISKCNVYEGKFNKIKYWVIRNCFSNNNDNNQNNNQNQEKTEEICIVKGCKSSLSCLVDELKKVFKLPKLGTHWCRLNNKTYILIRCNKTKEGYIKEELTLNMIDTYTPIMRMQIQEVFAFRELLGVTCSYESSIIIRENKSGSYPISFNEPNMMTGDIKVIPITVLDKWFEETSIDDVVKRLCRIQNIDKLADLLYKFRKKIEKIIERVDRRAITYKNCIIDRITQRIQTTLN